MSALLATPRLTSLSAEEWRVISELRELPDSRFRRRTLEVVDRLLDFAREPRCAEMQADGVPCASAAVACDECRHATAVLDALREVLKQG